MRLPRRAASLCNTHHLPQLGMTSGIDSPCSDGCLYNLNVAVPAWTCDDCVHERTPVINNRVGEQVVFAGEVAEEGASRDSGGLGDFVDSRLLESLPVKEGNGGVVNKSALFPFSLYTVGFQHAPAILAREPH